MRIEDFKRDARVSFPLAHDCPSCACTAEGVLRAQVFAHNDQMHVVQIYRTFLPPSHGGVMHTVDIADVTLLAEPLKPANYFCRTFDFLGALCVSNSSPTGEKLTADTPEQAAVHAVERIEEDPEMYTGEPVHTPYFDVLVYGDTKPRALLHQFRVTRIRSHKVEPLPEGCTG